MKKKMMCLSIIGMFLLTGFTSLSVIGLEVNTDIRSFDEIEPEEIQLSYAEINQLYDWCNSFDDIDLHNEVEQALDDTITSSGVLYVTALEERLNELEHEFFPDGVEPAGILPPTIIVRCKWNVKSDSEGEATVRFYIFGFGNRILYWTIIHDWDGDGDAEHKGDQSMDLRLLFLNYVTDWGAWGGIKGRATVTVQNYHVDNHGGYSKTFQEPNTHGRQRNILQRFTSPLLLRYLMRFLDQSPLLGRLLNLN